MKLGFTGSRFGMTPKQKDKMHELLLWYADATWFSHGDCLGADAQAHGLVREILPKCKIHTMPAGNGSWRAWCAADVTDPDAPALVRNRKIVNSSDVMFATPYEDEEMLRGGTWSTVRYSREKLKKLFVVLPNGETI